MILSVLKNTQRPVKFWFIKNYLSPQFKVCLHLFLHLFIFHFENTWFLSFIYFELVQDVIPHMAQEYGFEYELITYKWPTWLHKQKEKQRIIWAYKILFLDVIFPLSLRKVCNCNYQMHLLIVHLYSFPLVLSLRVRRFMSLFLFFVLVDEL